MLKHLVKNQLRALFQNYFYNRKTGQLRPMKTTISFLVLFFVFIVLVIGGMFAGFSYLISSLITSGMAWLYFDFMMGASILFGCFGSVFNTFSSVYKAKDNDLLLSMPIPINKLLISRLTVVYLMGLLYGGVAFIPGIIVYFIYAPSLSALNIIGPFVMLLMITIFILVLSCALGWVVAKISTKIKNKSFVTVIISLVFIGAYFFVYSYINTLITNIVNNLDNISEQLGGTFLYYLGNSCVGDPLPLLIASIVVLALLALTLLIFNKTFINLVTSSGKSTHKRYEATKVKKVSVNIALLKREFRRFFTSAAYMLNCGLGTIFLPAIGIFTLIRGDWMYNNFVQILPEASMIPLLGVVMCLMCSSMNDITAPSVSLEGKYMYQLQVLPISPWQVLKSKVIVHLALTLAPALFASIAIAISLKAGIALGILMVLFTVIFVYFNALVGLVANLKFPNLKWSNELMVVKQGLPIFISLVGTWLVTIILALVYFLVYKFIPAEGYLGICLVLISAFSAYLTYWTKTKGTKILATL